MQMKKRANENEALNPSASKKYDNEDFASMLKVFYDRVFPFDAMYKWLSYSSPDPETFHRREFSMTFQGDIYARYQCYRDAEEFAAAIRKSAPIKIDIGAVFNARPSEHKSLPAPIVPVERELVFDIDLTDYDNVRTCCSKASVCQKCFSFMSIAVKVLDDVLRVDFGFKHLLWVFSGRRGIHCWVCDSSARRLSNAERSAVADYISVQVLKDNELTISTKVEDHERAMATDYPRDKASSWTKLHPTLDRLYNKYLLPTFEKVIVEEQFNFRDPNIQNLLLKDFRSEVADALREEWNQDTTNTHKWKKFKATCYQLFGKHELQHTNPVLDVVFRTVYPRLDINVSKGLNHLLKSPFVVHPSTGNVCVPLDPSTIDHFQLSSVPKLAAIMAQLDAGGPTHMDSCVSEFRRLFLDPLEAANRSERLAAKQQRQNADLDF